jgi:hypothetical protein
MTKEKLTFIQNLVNRLLFRQLRTNRCFAEFMLCVEGKAGNKFLFILLNLMSLVLLVDPEFRMNVKRFSARYVFRDKADKLYIVAEFKDNRIKVRRRRLVDAKLTLVFKDGKSLFKLLLSESPDVLDALLNQEVNFSGNINYLNKFAFMAMRLRSMAMEKIGVT